MGGRPAGRNDSGWRVVTRRRDLERHRDSLEEIGEILTSMKTLAFMETRKLSRFLLAQQNVVESITEAATDFLAFYPAAAGPADEAATAILAVGTERGFCGDFNRRIRRRIDYAVEEFGAERLRVIAIGQKLRPLLEDEPSTVTVLDGASVVEEIPAVLQSVIDALQRLQEGFGGLRLLGIHQADDRVLMSPLLPPVFPPSDGSTGPAFPPMLNVPAQDLFPELVDHYLFAALHNMLYSSLMAENQRRVQHLEGAVRYIGQKSAELTRRCRALRQEEIIEEIEVILLSVTGDDTGDAGREGA